AELTLERALDAANKNNSSQSYDFGATASYSALNAFLRSETRDERASALAALGRALGLRQMWRETIATYRASVALIANPDVQKALDDAVAQHGFRITSNEVDAEAPSPRICVVFSETL